MEAVNGGSSLGDDKGGPPPPSPLTGCYLLIVVGEPHSQEHKEIILQRIAKGLLSWNVNDCLVNLEKELTIITDQGLEGEEARYGERLIQFASENLVTEILIHPSVSTLSQCIRNLLSSFTKHRHIIHAGYAFQGNGSWALQDGTFSYSDFCEAFQEIEVQRVIHAYENSISLHLHCSLEGEWGRLSKENFAKMCKVRVNPTDVLTIGTPPISNFIKYLVPFLIPSTLESILESSDVVGNIRFSRPTLYVFPGGQGDAALFGINGFNMLLDGGYSRKACFWDFVRHLDRLDAVLISRLNNSNVSGISSVLKRKRQGAVYPQIGHFFCNIPERKSLLSPDGDKDKDPLILSLVEDGQKIVQDLRYLNLAPQPCYRDNEPIILYHKVGHGTLNMYVLSPDRNSREVREFIYKWNQGDTKLFAGSRGGRDFVFPLQNLVSICVLLVWQPSNPNDTITRILYPGSASQKKIIEGLDRLKTLEYVKHPVCTEKSLAPAKKTKQEVIEKLVAKEKPIGDKKIENKMLIEDALKNGDLNGDVKEKHIIKSHSTDSEKEKKSKKENDIKIEDVTKIEDKVKAKAKPVEVKPAKPKVELQPKKKPIPEKKAPPTPKKTVENKTNGEIKEKDRKQVLKPSPTATPAKSTKDANNRKVVESKRQPIKKETISKPASAPPATEAKAKTERKPISRRPKTAKAPVSPAKKITNGVQKPDSISKRGKLDKEGTTDSSTVSTPSADQDSLLKKDISKLTPEEIQQLKERELEELKEEQEAVKEIEAVFRKDEERPEEIEAGLRKIKDVSIDDKLEADEYLIIEKEEVEHDSLNQETKEDEMLKLARDSEESEKRRKLSSEEKEIETNKVQSKETKESVPGKIPEAAVSLSDDKVTDKKEILEDEVKEVGESHPEEKVSATVESGATTTAPTLPEDDGITLDEIKEDNGQVIEEKHVKEETKEKELPIIQLPPKAQQEVQSKIQPGVGIPLDKQKHIKDIVKTPDEVADLPVHEEVDYHVFHTDDKKIPEKELAAKPLPVVKDVEVKRDDKKIELAIETKSHDTEKPVAIDLSKESEDTNKLKSEKTVAEIQTEHLSKVTEPLIDEPKQIVAGKIEEKTAALIHDEAKKHDQEEISPEPVRKHSIIEQKPEIPTSVDKPLETVLKTDDKTKISMTEKTEELESKDGTAADDDFATTEKLSETIDDEWIVVTKESDEGQELKDNLEEALKDKDIEEAITDYELNKTEKLEAALQDQIVSEFIEKDLKDAEKLDAPLAMEDHKDKKDIKELEIKHISKESKDDKDKSNEKIDEVAILKRKDLTQEDVGDKLIAQDHVDKEKNIDSTKLKDNELQQSEVEQIELVQDMKDKVEGKKVNEAIKLDDKEHRLQEKIDAEKQKEIVEDETKLQISEKPSPAYKEKAEEKKDVTKIPVQTGLQQAEKDHKHPETITGEKSLVLTPKEEDLKQADEKDKKTTVPTTEEKLEHAAEIPAIISKETILAHDEKDSKIAKDIDGKVKGKERKADTSLISTEQDLKVLEKDQKMEEKQQNLPEHKIDDSKKEEKITDSLNETVIKASEKPVEVTKVQDNKDAVAIKVMATDKELLDKIEDVKDVKKAEKEPAQGHQEKTDAEKEAIDYSDKVSPEDQQVTKETMDEKILSLKEEQTEVADMDDKLQELKKTVHETVDEIQMSKVKSDVGEVEAKHHDLKHEFEQIADIESKLQELKSVSSENLANQEEFKIEQTKAEPEHAEELVLCDSSPDEDINKERLLKELDIDKENLGRKSPAEREEDVKKIVASVAEVLKSEAPLEELASKLPFTQELRETHITTQEIPLAVESKVIITEDIPPIPEETTMLEDETKHESRKDLLAGAQELMAESSKMISGIKSKISDEKEPAKDDEKDDDAGTVHRMLVTASSEDGGEETEICPAGTINFAKSSESSGRSSPELIQKSQVQKSIAAEVSEIVSSGKDLVEKGMKAADRAAKDKVEEISTSVDDLKSESHSILKQAADKVDTEVKKDVGFVEDKYNVFKDGLTEKTDIVISKSEEVIKQVEEAAVAKIQQLGSKTEKGKEDLKEEVKHIEETVVKKVEDFASMSGEELIKTEEAAIGKVPQIDDKIDKEKVEIKDAAKHTEQNLLENLDNLKSEVIETVGTAMEKTKETVKKIDEAISTKICDVVSEGNILEEKSQKLIHKADEAIHEKTVDLISKGHQLEEKIEEVKDKSKMKSIDQGLKQAEDTVATKIEDSKEQMEQELKKSSENISESKDSKYLDEKLNDVIVTSLDAAKEIGKPLGDNISTITETTHEKIETIKDDLIQKAEFVLDKAEETSKQLEEAAVTKIQQLESKIEMGKEDLKEEVKHIEEALVKKVEDFASMSGEELKIAEEAAIDKVPQIDDKIEKEKVEIKDTVKHIEQGFLENFDNLKSEVTATVGTAFEKTEETAKKIAAAISTKMDDVVSEGNILQEKSQQLIHEADDAIHKKTENWISKGHQLEENIEKVKDNLTTEVKSQVEIIDQGLKKAENIVTTEMEDSKEQVEQVLKKTSEDVSESVADSKYLDEKLNDVIFKSIDAAKEIGKPLSNDILKIAESTHEKIETAKEGLMQKTESVVDKAEGTGKQLAEAAVSKTGDLLSDSKNVMQKIEDGIVSSAHAAVNKVEAAIHQAKEDLTSQTAEVEHQIEDDLSKIKSKLDDRIEDVKSVAPNIPSEIKGFGTEVLDAIFGKEKDTIDKDTSKVESKVSKEAVDGNIPGKLLEDKKDEIIKKPSDATAAEKEEHLQKATMVDLQQSAPKITDDLNRKDSLVKDDKQSIDDVHVENLLKQKEKVVPEQKIDEKTAENLDEKFDQLNKGLADIAMSTDEVEEYKVDKDILKKDEKQIEAEIDQLKQGYEDLTKLAKDVGFDKCDIDKFKIDKDTIEKETKQLEEEADELRKDYEDLTKLTEEIPFQKCKEEDQFKIDKETIAKEEKKLGEQAEYLTRSYEDLSKLAEEIPFDKCKTDECKIDKDVIEKEEKQLEEIADQLRRSYEDLTKISEESQFDKCKTNELHLAKDIPEKEEKQLKETTGDKHIEKPLDDLDTKYKNLHALSSQVPFDKCKMTAEYKVEKDVIEREEKEIDEKVLHLQHSLSEVNDLAQSITFDKCLTKTTDKNEPADEKQEFKGVGGKTEIKISGLKEELASAEKSVKEETPKPIIDSNKLAETVDKIEISEKIIKDQQEQEKDQEKVTEKPKPEPSTHDLKEDEKKDNKQDLEHGATPKINETDIVAISTGKDCHEVSEKSITDAIKSEGKKVEQKQEIDERGANLSPESGETSKLEKIEKKEEHPCDPKLVIGDKTFDNEVKDTKLITENQSLKDELHATDAKDQQEKKELTGDGQKSKVDEKQQSKTEDAPVDINNSRGLVSSEAQHSLSDQKTVDLICQDKAVVDPKKETFDNKSIEQELLDEQHAKMLSTDMKKDYKISSEQEKSIKDEQHQKVEVATHTSDKTSTTQPEKSEKEVMEKVPSDKDSLIVCNDIKKVSVLDVEISIKTETCPKNASHMFLESERALTSDSCDAKVFIEPVESVSSSHITSQDSPNQTDHHAQMGSSTLQLSDTDLPSSGKITPPTVPVSPIAAKELKSPSLKLDSGLSEQTETDDDDLSTKSQVGQSELDELDMKMDPMSMSFYGALPDTEGHSDIDVPPSLLYETTKAKYAVGVKMDESEPVETYGDEIDLMTASFIGELPSGTSDIKRESDSHSLEPSPSTSAPSYLYEITKAKYTLFKESAKDFSTDQSKTDTTNDPMTTSVYFGEDDPIASWGRPLKLPSPAPPNNNNGTPKKERKVPAYVSAKNKLNDDRKRAESPSKFRAKKINPIYVDLTYVPHHGNHYYSYVDFFKKIRARYYVFSGLEPSRQVYDALLEAKQTWEDKELEVTIIPTYDTDILGYWIAENEDLLSKFKIDLSPSASRCTINLQDHETSCSAYRLEF